MIKKKHITTVILLAIYFIITQTSFFTGLITSIPFVLAFVINIVISIFFGVLFLYIFSHEKLFNFAKDLGRQNSQREKLWLHRFKNLGKSTAVLLIGILLGPLFAAITAQILLPKFKYKYTLVVFTSVVSAILWLGLARGIISFTLPFFQ